MTAFIPSSKTPSSLAVSSPKGFRADIQGLRAVAVGLVVIFHIFPNLVTGGYVGVDVFFVISGYLISGLLLRRVERDGRVDFKQFYISRARRLLPAACLTLIVTGLAALFILPKSQLSGLGREILTSAFYVENFYLYFQGRDYLAADTAPSPLQHFWSLSIEEQFYIFWPLTIALGVMIANRFKISARVIILVFLTLITLTSFYLSVTISPKDPGAYFLTSTRVWELALGGLLAFGQPFLKLPVYFSRLLRWLGLSAIVYSGLTFTKATVFPGSAALIPTLGALALLLPRTPGALDPSSLLSSRPMVYIGDISYSLYLWHWPIIILGGYVVGGQLTLWQNGLAFALMITVSHVSKYYVEDKFRHSKGIKNSGRRTFGLSTAFLGGSIIAAALLIVPSLKSFNDIPRDDLGDYIGAYALEGSQVFTPREFIPSASVAALDNPALYADGCHVTSQEDVPKPCIYGNPESALTIALVGDSHAAQYLPTLRRLAETQNFRIITHTKSSCPFLDATTLQASGPYTTCTTWNKAVMAELLALKPNVVVTAKFSSTTLAEAVPGQSNDTAVSNALKRHWKTLGEAGISVVAIAYTPRFPNNVADCVSKPGNVLEDCDVDRASALVRFDHIRAAGELFPDATIANLNDRICTVETCSAVVGNILVYRDAHHLTATYARTLDRALGVFIEQALPVSDLEQMRMPEPLNLPKIEAEYLFKLIPDREQYPGALSFVLPEETKSPTAPVSPELRLLGRDFNPSFANGCYSAAVGFNVKSCELGAKDASRHIVVVGDNAATMWVSAIEPYAKLRGVRVTTFLKSGCPFTSVAPLYRDAVNQDCVKWTNAVVSEINALNPDLVLTTTYATSRAAIIEQGETSKSALGRGIAARLEQVKRENRHIITLAQLPTQDPNLLQCLASVSGEGGVLTTSSSNAAGCGTPRDVAMRRQDPMEIVSRNSDVMEYWNMTDYFCTETFCPAVLGGRITFKDTGHVTHTYMQTLAPFLGAKLDERLGFEN